MKFFNKNIHLQESTYSDLVNNISSSALAHPYMSDKLRTTGPKSDLTSVDKIDIKAADKYLNATNIPCIMILGTREDEHATFKLDTIGEMDIDGFYDKAKEIVADSLTYSNPDTYEALLFNKSTNNKPYLVRRLSVVNKAEKSYEMANMYQFNVTVTSVSEEKKYVDNQKYIISERISNKDYNGPKVIKALHDALKAIEIEPFVETPDMKKAIDDSLKEGDTVHSLKVETKNKIRYPVWINYGVTEINIDSKTVELTPITNGDDDYNPDEINNNPISVTPDELKNNYYFGEFLVDIDYRNTCTVSYDVAKITGDTKQTSKGTCYTSIENFKKFMEESLNPVAVNESVQSKYRNIITRAYSDKKAPYKSVIHNFNNITNIKRDITQLLSDPNVYFVDSYDEAGVCHYQSEKIVDYDANTYDWNVMTDDFFETSKDSKRALSLTEAVEGTEYQVIFHLPYFDVNDSDNPDNSSEVKKTITALSKAKCLKYAENLIRSNSKDITWKDAFVDSIEPLNKQGDF